MPKTSPLTIDSVLEELVTMLNKYQDDEGRFRILGAAADTESLVSRLANCGITYEQLLQRLDSRFDDKVRLRTLCIEAELFSRPVSTIRVATPTAESRAPTPPLSAVGHFFSACKRTREGEKNEPDGLSPKSKRPRIGRLTSEEGRDLFARFCLRAEKYLGLDLGGGNETSSDSDLSPKN